VVKEVLQEIMAIVSTREKFPGQFLLDVPVQITKDQQMRVAAPLRKSSQEEMQRVIRELEAIGTFGPQMAGLVRAALASPAVALAGKSPFDGYLTICRNTGVNGALVRAIQHLRDVITVVDERFFTDPTRGTIRCELHPDRITPTMLKQVEECLREVDTRVLRDPMRNRWINGPLQRFFDRVKMGTFVLPARAVAVRVQSASGPLAANEDAGYDAVPEETRALNDGLRTLREHLAPQYLDLPPKDFAALCRSDEGARDAAQRMGKAIERFSVRCLGAVRQKFLEGCAALASGNGASAEDAVDAGKCLQPLTEEAASFRSWLEGGWPQEENSMGGDLWALAESSLVSGLFLVFLERRFAELFQDVRDEGMDDPRHRGEAKALAARRLAKLQGIEATLKQQRQALPALVAKGESPAIALDVAKYCEDALVAVVPLFVLAARSKEPNVTAPYMAGKLSQSFLSAEGVCTTTSDGLPDCLELVEHDPGAFPYLRCRYIERNEDQEATSEPAQVCRFSRRGGVVLSPRIAIPVSTLFGEESRLARLAAFLGSEANRHVAEWRRLAGTAEFRQCVPYLEGDAAHLARVHIRGGEFGGGVTLLALPAAAMAMSDVFAENATFPQALEHAPEESPAKVALLRAVEAYWREKDVAPADYSLCDFKQSVSVGKQEAEKTGDELHWRRRVRRFLNQKTRWPLPDAEAILNSVGIVIEPKEDGAPHGKIRLDQRHITLPSRPLKDKEMYATSLCKWIRELGQERKLAGLLDHMRKPDAGEEQRIG
jgi:hypothetical protein